MIEYSRFLNKFTMYRLMLYFLCLLLSLAIFLSIIGILPYRASDIILQAVFLVGICWGANTLAARLVKTKPNFESSIITALILSLIFGPAPITEAWKFLIVAALAAIISKYLFVKNRSHIFNPAAFGAVASALIIGQPASWWIGGIVMAPIIIAGGVLIIQKIRRFHLVGSFLAIYFSLLFLDILAFGGGDFFVIAVSLKNLLIASPLLFFLFVMIVEPLTSPQTLRHRVYFGLLIAVSFFALQKFIPSVEFSLELSLLIGNILARVIASDFRQVFVLARKEEPVPGAGNFWFEPMRSFSFIPGQFLEYTLQHRRADDRGVRRYFTIASAPTEKQILLATKFSNKGSTFKQALKSMNIGDEIIASKVAGEFVLPADFNQKIVFIAGGIGITPFRSMVKYLLDTGQSRNIVLLYGARTANDFAFRDIFEEARRRFGMINVYAFSDSTAVSEKFNGRQSKINEALIREEAPDWRERVFYVSGPEPMVQSMEKILAGMDIPAKNIKRDYFFGYEE